MITPHNDCTLDEHYSPEDQRLPLAFVQKRHTETIEGVEVIDQSWRMKERVMYISTTQFRMSILFLTPFRLRFQMKTVSVALVVCLNIGVDPPDIVKTQPCARLECWIGKDFCSD